jgi:hypothetical protein
VAEAVTPSSAGRQLLMGKGGIQEGMDNHDDEQHLPAYMRSTARHRQKVEIKKADKPFIGRRARSDSIGGLLSEEHIGCGAGVL